MNQQAARTLALMSDSKIPEIQEILSEVDGLLRERLQSLGVEIHHVLLATTPNGAGVVRSNVGPDVLGDLAEMLMDIAEKAAASRPRNEPLN